MIETEYLVDAGGNQLAGTLTLPNSEGKFPTVIYLQGSGKMDRNDNFPSSKDKTPKSTRDFFNSLGFATLRYDKRGVADSEGDFYSASHQDLVDDAIHVLDFVLQNDSCDSDKIFLLGHSEGCFISCEVIAQRSCIAGTILLCPVYKSIEETLLNQAQSMKTLAENQSGIGGVIMRTYFRISDPVKSHRKFVEKIKKFQKRCNALHDDEVSCGMV